jgi:hypothetical protein
MTNPGLRLRHLSMHGPGRVPASIQFGPGLNVLFGASDTGKSFVVDIIDFMLGGKPPIPEITERVGYDQILMGAETIAGEQFTLVRSSEGGGFRVYDGLFIEPPDPDVRCVEMGEQHSEKNSDNLSTFLLERSGLAGKRVRKNKTGVTNSLSFRNLARLLIVNETEIIQKRSPLSDGNPTSDTSNFATFKLLLTGIDDASLVQISAKVPEDQSREVQLDLLSKLVEEHRERLADLTKSPDELKEQYERIQASIADHEVQLASTESEFRSLADRRRELRRRLEEGQDRRAEIGSLLERFSLLDRHYVSDVARLRGIEEGGTLFEVLGKGSCPLCGAEAAHHRREADCEGDVASVVAAAQAEIAKIDLLRRELGGTVSELRREGASFDRRIPKLETELRSLSATIERMISPKLVALRSTYAKFADKRGQVREAMAIYQTIQDMERRRFELEAGSGGPKETAVAEGDLPMAVADKFALHIEGILKEWHFPGAERVFFDPKARDLVIGGKPRAARGKGLRAITHAAFTVGLLEYCKINNTPHPGFVVLDSPLLAYRAPDGIEDDLRGTDLDEQFYAYLANLPEDRQLIIIENSDPPAGIRERPQVLMFSANPHSGRYGYFPVSTNSADGPSSR